MQHDPRAWLWDVRLAADSIAAFVQGRSFADYAADLMLRSAVERQFAIIGEALSQLARVDQGLASRILELRRVIAFRTCSSMATTGLITQRSGASWRPIYRRCVGTPQTCSWNLVSHRQRGES